MSVEFSVFPSDYIGDSGSTMPVRAELQGGEVQGCPIGETFYEGGTTEHNFDSLDYYVDTPNYTVLPVFNQEKIIFNIENGSNGKEAVFKYGFNDTLTRANFVVNLTSHGYAIVIARGKVVLYIKTDGHIGLDYSGNPDANFDHTHTLTFDITIDHTSAPIILDGVVTNDLGVTKVLHTESSDSGHIYSGAIGFSLPTSFNSAQIGSHMEINSVFSSTSTDQLGYDNQCQGELETYNVELFDNLGVSRDTQVVTGGEVISGCPVDKTFMSGSPSFLSDNFLQPYDQFNFGESIYNMSTGQNSLFFPASSIDFFEVKIKINDSHRVAVKFSQDATNAGFGWGTWSGVPHCTISDNLGTVEKLPVSSGDIVTMMFSNNVFTLKNGVNTVSYNSPIVLDSNTQFLFEDVGSEMIYMYITGQGLPNQCTGEVLSKAEYIYDSSNMQAVDTGEWKLVADGVEAPFQVDITSLKWVSEPVDQVVDLDSAVTVEAEISGETATLELSDPNGAVVDIQTGITANYSYIVPSLGLSNRGLWSLRAFTDLEEINSEFNLAVNAEESKVQVQDVFNSPNTVDFTGDPITGTNRLVTSYTVSITESVKTQDVYTNTTSTINQDIYK